jgi:hypothetical protein
VREISPSMMRLIEESLLEIWSELRGESTQQAATAKKRIAELERRKQRLVQAYVYDQAKVWKVASAPRKRLLQALIFPEGVTFDGKGLGTPATSFIFSLLGGESCDVENLVEPKGVEPSTS